MIVFLFQKAVQLFKGVPMLKWIGVAVVAVLAVGGFGAYHVSKASRASAPVANKLLAMSPEEAAIFDGAMTHISLINAEAMSKMRPWADKVVPIANAHGIGNVNDYGKTFIVDLEKGTILDVNPLTHEVSPRVIGAAKAQPKTAEATKQVPANPPDPERPGAAELELLKAKHPEAFKGDAGVKK